ncbi:MAG TPA: bifunctional 5,10-methylenetetrahydrofolate dehydrogenase/5,10-methenyltetrahydrofolate cyclohydrolase [Candidatus Deferrimicrobium sp.]|nr:bifunctional 5,10-methylenetetrahydrofolate dehydrogenase/5,10-methenyltetrahydrofolate cyclohydrolase [Candidatus Deferrimicrobium sp.]
MDQKILDGKKVADFIEIQIKSEIESLIKSNSVIPGLATILVGENPASKIYVNIKQKACAQVGINSKIITLPETISEDDLLSRIEELNVNPSIHGILVQLPLPANIKLIKVFSAIDPQKDVDCFHPENFGKLLIGNEDLVPCTPKGIIYLLEYYKIPISGQDVVIVNHSTLLGKPLSLMFLNRDATVSIAHIKTKNLKNITRIADILVVGAGVPNLIKNDMIKDNVVIIDAGISRIAGKIVGDVDFENVINKVRAITPVPGGVGPMTVACLLQNTLITYKNLCC